MNADSPSTINPSPGKPKTAAERLGCNNSATAPPRSQSIAWEPTLPLETVGNLPLFPVHCLPGVLKDYAEAVAESTQTAVDMAAVAALAVMATCVQGKYKIQGKPDWIEPLNLYCVIVANPAERKSAVLLHLSRYVDEFEYKENERLQPDIAKSRLDKKLLQKEVDKLVEICVKDSSQKDALMAKQDELTNFQDMKPLRLLADDASAEALTSLLAENGGKMAVKWPLYPARAAYLRFYKAAIRKA